MLGELLFDIKGRITGSRIVNADEYKVEHSVIEEGKFKDIEITILGTFLTIPTTEKHVTYVKGQGIITTKDGEDRYHENNLSPISFSFPFFVTFEICNVIFLLKNSVSEISLRVLILFLFVEPTFETRGVGFEPTCSYEHGISNPTPYQARRPPLYKIFHLSMVLIT